MCYLRSWMSFTGAFSVSLLYVGFMVMMAKSMELHNYYKFKDSYMFNASSGSDLFRVRSVIECSQICSTKNSCAGFNFGLQKDGSRSTKSCALFFELDLLGDVCLRTSELSVYVAITHLNYFISSQVLEQTTCKTSATSSKATPGSVDSTSSSVAYSSPVTQATNSPSDTIEIINISSLSSSSSTITSTKTTTKTTTAAASITLTASSSQQTTTYTAHLACTNPDALLRVTDGYYILIAGQTAFLYNNYTKLTVEANGSQPLSSLFTGSSDPVIAAYDDDTYIYLVHATSVYIYTKKNRTFVKTDSVTNHFKTTLSISIADMLWDSNTKSVWIFTATDLRIIDQDGHTDVKGYDNGSDNPYRATNPSDKPDNIQAVSRDSELRDVFVADNKVYVFNRESHKGTWSILGDLKC